MPVCRVRLEARLPLAPLHLLRCGYTKRTHRSVIKGDAGTGVAAAEQGAGDRLDIDNPIDVIPWGRRLASSY
jgi:hypothetical protein